MAVKFFQALTKPIFPPFYFHANFLGIPKQPKQNLLTMLRLLNIFSILHVMKVPYSNDTYAAYKATSIDLETERVGVIFGSSILSLFQLGGTTLLAYLLRNKISPKHPIMVTLLGGILGAMTLFKIEDMASHAYFKSVRKEEEYNKMVFIDPRDKEID
jgi:hypothetical protein